VFHPWFLELAALRIKLHTTSFEYEVNKLFKTVAASASVSSLDVLYLPSVLTVACDKLIV
jgi:hypothetical protein